MIDNDEQSEQSDRTKREEKKKNKEFQFFYTIFYSIKSDQRSSFIPCEFGKLGEFSMWISYRHKNIDKILDISINKSEK